jgi:archaellum component FlaC
MKKFISFLLVLLPLFFSCNKQGSNSEVQELKEENQRLRLATDEKDSSLNAYMQSLNEIEDNLVVIKEKENYLNMKSKDSEFQKTQQDQIVSDIQLISELMAKNKQQIASLSKKIKNGNGKIAELEKMIDRITKQLEERDSEIASLKENLQKVNAALVNLFKEYNNRVEELDEQTGELNTAYYAYGTTKELKQQGVITKEGGFIGIGRTEKLMNDFKRDYFTRVNIMETPFVLLNCKKASLITTHPSGSYRFEGAGKVDKLTITDPKEFWATSRYLVIVTE